MTSLRDLKSRIKRIEPKIKLLVFNTKNHYLLEIKNTLVNAYITLRCRKYA
jgi:succinate dehydrogenase/fumarate reductase flavoprotein subunit